LAESRNGEKLDKLLETSTESANDIKWLKTTLGEAATRSADERGRILDHLAKLNDTSGKNKTRSTVNRYMITGIFATMGIIISIILHLMGVY